MTTRHQRTLSISLASAHSQLLSLVPAVVEASEAFLVVAIVKEDEMEGLRRPNSEGWLAEDESVWQEVEDDMSMKDVECCSGSDRGRDPGRGHVSSLLSQTRKTRTHLVPELSEAVTRRHAFVDVLLVVIRSDGVLRERETAGQRRLILLVFFHDIDRNVRHTTTRRGRRWIATSTGR